MNHADPIAAIHQEHVAAVKNGDIAVLLRDLEDAVVYMPPADMTLIGKKDVEAWWREYFEFFTVLDFETTERVLEAVGDCAIERVAFSLKLIATNGGTPIYDDGRFLTVWRRQPDGTWKIWQRIWNSLKPIGAGTNRFLVRFMQRPEE
jgi:ketosteroid isomerase-like protein